MSINLPCPYCTRLFADANAVYNHAKVKHKKEKTKALRPERDDEPSLAEIAIEAMWKRDAGLPLDALEESLLP